MKEVVVQILLKEVTLDESEVSNLVEMPQDPKLGDYAFPCFSLAKAEKKAPVEIASDLSEKLKKHETKEIASIEQNGPYVNFFVNKHLLAEEVLQLTKGKSWGSVNVDTKTIAVEYPGPNTNKELHLGHVRNIATGDAAYHLLKAAGNKVHHVNIYNDRGVHICKSMIGYEKYAQGKTPGSENKKSDQFVGDLYSQFGKEAVKNKELEEEAQKKLQLWEQEDKETIKLWKKLNDWVYKGMQETYETLGMVKIEKNYYESEMYKEGRELVNEGLKKGIFFKKEDGAIAIDLEEEGLGEKIVLRADGTSIYITQDLYLADKRVKDLNLDASYYVVGNEQDYHFKTLFVILEKLGIKKDLRHLSYGMIALPTGKMKSREGKVVSADDLIDQTMEAAKKGLLQRDNELSEKEAESRALTIALAAIKYSMLKVDIKKQIVFNPDADVAFEGDTGPYLLYSYARANSILKKADGKEAKKPKIIDLNDSEVSLIKKIYDLPNVITKAYKNLSPNTIANYSFDLAKTFNEFYHASQVIGGPEEEFRLELVRAFKITLKKSLGLLGIETLEEM